MAPAVTLSRNSTLLCATRSFLDYEHTEALFLIFHWNQLPCVALIGNDASWGQIAREQVPMFQSSVACDLSPCNYQVVAEGYGAQGTLISDHSQIARAIAEAQVFRVFMIAC